MLESGHIIGSLAPHSFAAKSGLCYNSPGKFRSYIGRWILQRYTPSRRKFARMPWRSKVTPLLRAIALGSASLAFMLSNAANAQAGASDAHCFLVSNVFATSTNEEVKALAVQSSFFYLGRLKGSSAQVEAELARAAIGISDENSAQILQLCLQDMSARAQEVKAAGERLRKATSK